MIPLAFRKQIVLLCGFLVVACVSGCSLLPVSSDVPNSKYLTNLPANNQQVIIVEPVIRSYARVTTWEFKNGHWQSVFGPMRAMVGRNGIAPLDEKKEGDGQTPSGIYNLKLAFGYEDTIDTKLNYRQSTENDFWVDDIHSPQYNQWVVGKPNAASFEEMKRKDGLYKYGAVIEYNTHPIVPGNGSAIFMHIWRGPGKPTSGCVSFSPRSIRHLLTWLDIKRDPVIILISKQEKQ